MDRDTQCYFFEIAHEIAEKRGYESLDIAQHGLEIGMDTNNQQDILNAVEILAAAMLDTPPFDAKLNDELFQWLTTRAIEKLPEKILQSFPKDSSLLQLAISRDNRCISVGGYLLLNILQSEARNAVQNGRFEDVLLFLSVMGRRLMIPTALWNKEQQSKFIAMALLNGKWNVIAEILMNDDSVQSQDIDYWSCEKTETDNTPSLNRLITGTTIETVQASLINDQERSALFIYVLNDIAEPLLKTPKYFADVLKGMYLYRLVLLLGEGKSGSEQLKAKNVKLLRDVSSEIENRVKADNPVLYAQWLENGELPILPFNTDKYRWAEPFFPELSFLD